MRRFVFLVSGWAMLVAFAVFHWVPEPFNGACEIMGWLRLVAMVGLILVVVCLLLTGDEDDTKLINVLRPTPGVVRVVSFVGWFVAYGMAGGGLWRCSML